MAVRVKNQNVSLDWLDEIHLQLKQKLEKGFAAEQLEIVLTKDQYSQLLICANINKSGEDVLESSPTLFGYKVIVC